MKTTYLIIEPYVSSNHSHRGVFESSCCETFSFSLQETCPKLNKIHTDLLKILPLRLYNLVKGKKLMNNLHQSYSYLVLIICGRTNISLSFYVFSNTAQPTSLVWFESFPHNRVFHSSKWKGVKDQVVLFPSKQKAFHPTQSCTL